MNGTTHSGRRVVMIARRVHGVNDDPANGNKQQHPSETVPSPVYAEEPPPHNEGGGSLVSRLGNSGYPFPSSILRAFPNHACGVRVRSHAFDRSCGPGEEDVVADFGEA